MSPSPNIAKSNEPAPPEEQGTYLGGASFDSLHWIELEEDPAPPREGGALGYVAAIILLVGLIYYIFMY
jgi:hypothetical protein